jgi:hypothetical protein
VATLTLGVAIGANIAAFSLIDGLFLEARAARARPRRSIAGRSVRLNGEK